MSTLTFPRWTRPLAVSTILATATLGTLTACSASTLDADKLSQEITTQVQALVPEGTQTSVDCPSDIKPEQGGTFTCTLTVNARTPRSTSPRPMPTATSRSSPSLRSCSWIRRRTRSPRK